MTPAAIFCFVLLGAGFVFLMVVRINNNLDDLGIDIYDIVNKKDEELLLFIENKYVDRTRLLLWKVLYSRSDSWHQAKVKAVIDTPLTAQYIEMMIRIDTKLGMLEFVDMRTKVQVDRELMEEFKKLNASYKALT